MTLGTVVLRLRIALVHGLDMHGMEGMQIEDGLDVFGTASDLVHSLGLGSTERVGIEEKESAIAAPDQRNMGADIDQTADPEAAADIPVAVADGDDVLAHVGHCQVY